MEPDAGIVQHRSLSLSLACCGARDQIESAHPAALSTSAMVRGCPECSKLDDERLPAQEVAHAASPMCFRSCSLTRPLPFALQPLACVAVLDSDR